MPQNEEDDDDEKEKKNCRNEGKEKSKIKKQTNKQT